MAERARAALLAGRSKEFCGLLTAHGRHRALGFNVDFDEDGSIPPDSPRLPQNCPQIVDRELATYENPEINELTPLDELRRARIRIVHAEDSSARVALVPPGGGGPGAAAQVVKTDTGWRFDDSNVVPTGH